MIITIDGSRGAGKTTQGEILSTKLNLDYYDELCRNTWILPHQILDVTPLRHSIRRQTRIFAGLHTYHSLPNTGTIITWFWTDIVYTNLFYEENLDFIRRCLTFCNMPEPTASFYLDVPDEIRQQRLIVREKRDISVTPDPSLLEKFQFLESRLPYFHIIDGTMPAEAVTNAMLEKIHV